MSKKATSKLAVLDENKTNPETRVAVFQKREIRRTFYNNE